MPASKDAFPKTSAAQATGRKSGSDPKLDLGLLPIFQAIYQHRNLTRAGDQLGLSQPSISRALSRLRIQIGDPLFERSGRELVPTAHARTLAGELPQLLQQLQAIARKAPDASAKDSLLRIAAAPLAQSWLLMRLQPVPDAGLPSLKLLPLAAAEPLRAGLLGEELDFALSPQADLSAGQRIESKKVAEEDYVCALRPGHPAALLGALSLQDYLLLEHISLQDAGEDSAKDPVEKVLSQLNKRRRIRLDRVPPLAAVDWVMTSDLCLTCPLHLAEQKSLHCLTPPLALPPWTLYLHWRRDRGMLPPLSPLIALL